MEHGKLGEPYATIAGFGSDMEYVRDRASGTNERRALYHVDRFRARLADRVNISETEYRQYGMAVLRGFGELHKGMTDEDWEAIIDDMRTGSQETDVDNTKAIVSVFEWPEGKPIPELARFLIRKAATNYNGKIRHGVPRKILHEDYPVVEHDFLELLRKTEPIIGHTNPLQATLYLAGELAVHGMFPYDCVSQIEYHLEMLEGSKNSEREVYAHYGDAMRAWRKGLAGKPSNKIVGFLRRNMPHPLTLLRESAKHPELRYLCEDVAVDKKPGKAHTTASPKVVPERLEEVAGWALDTFKDVSPLSPDGCDILTYGLAEVARKRSQRGFIYLDRPQTLVSAARAKITLGYLVGKERATLEPEVERRMASVLDRNRELTAMRDDRFGNMERKAAWEALAKLYPLYAEAIASIKAVEDAEGVDSRWYCLNGWAKGFFRGWLK